MEGGGGVPDSGGRIYGYGEESKSYCLVPNQNGDDAPVLGTKMPE